MRKDFLLYRKMQIQTHTFAEQILEKYKKFGQFSLNAPSLIFAGESKTTAAVQTFHKSLQIKLNVKLSDAGASVSPAAFRMKLSGQEKAMRELRAFHCISTIFENRETQPDTARKAEQKLIRILSKDFYDRNPIIQRAVSGEQMSYRRERRAAEAEASMTKNLAESMEERLLLQEKMIKELKQTKTAPGALPKGWLEKVTKEVMKKMERELRLERVRRGLI